MHHWRWCTNPAIADAAKRVTDKSLGARPALRAELVDFLKAWHNRSSRPKLGVVIEDEEDVKLLAAAVGGAAQFLITDDRHLLEVGEHQGVELLLQLSFGNGGSNIKMRQGNVGQLG